MTTTPTVALGKLAENGPTSTCCARWCSSWSSGSWTDVERRCGAALNEMSAERSNSRSGYLERTWKTRAGTAELKIPKLHQGSYFPELLDPRRTAEKAPTAVIQEAYPGHRA